MIGRSCLPANCRYADFSISRLSNQRTGSDTVKQLGVFAKEDIEPGETVLNEVSLLTATARAHDLFCDACSARLTNVNTNAPENLSAPVACTECDDALFCSEACSDLAQSSYHAAICGKDIEAIARDVPASDSSDALYCLLLMRILAMAETQDAHPLDLPEVKYIWGDYDAATGFDHSEYSNPSLGIRSRLPFTFNENVLMPLHVLDRMEVNIFKSPRYDTWVINTLFAKFRGTASAKQGIDGRPEVGAVHPLWCLANHSCDPNVSWDWSGGMKLWARQQRALWEGKEERAAAGLQKGQEVLSHYCDITLSVKERRAWAVGALGGLCTCERCQWEEHLS